MHTETDIGTTDLANWTNVVAHVRLSPCRARGFRRALEALVPDAIVEIEELHDAGMMGLIVTVPAECTNEGKLGESIGCAIEVSGAEWASAQFAVEYRWMALDTRSPRACAESPTAPQA